MKIIVSKRQWELMGKKAGWMKKALSVIPDDGYLSELATGL
jgi:hypothetical protein